MNELATVASVAGERVQARRLGRDVTTAPSRRRASPATSNIRARITRALEALEDGDVMFAMAILSDLLVEWGAA